MNALSPFEITFVITAFLFQVILITHFALRKWHFDIAIRYGPIVYALGIAAAGVSIVLVLNHEPWYFWIGGLLYLAWATYGYWIDYVKATEWRTPLRWSILMTYIPLYLATVMFYWWPLAQIYKPLWYLQTLLFIASTTLNVTSHKRGDSITSPTKKHINFQDSTMRGSS